MELYENTLPGTEITHVEATSTSSLNFEIISGDKENTFLINPNNGIVMTRKEFDYEKIRTYNLSIVATNMVCIKIQKNLIILFQYQDSNNLFTLKMVKFNLKLSRPVSMLLELLFAGL